MRRLATALRAFWCVLRGGSVMVNVLQVYESERVIMSKPCCFKNVVCREDIRWDPVRGGLVFVVDAEDDAETQVLAAANASMKKLPPV